MMADFPETRRLPLTVYLLMCAQALAGAIPPIMVSLGGLVGGMLAPSPLLVTLPVSMFMIGTCCATLPAAFLFQKFGRQRIYFLGALTAATGGTVSAVGLYIGSFWVFCAGSLLFGLNIACVQSYRFAASHVGGASNQARAVSVVLLGGIGSAVIGPQIAIQSLNFELGVPYVSAFVGQSLLALATIPFILTMRLQISTQSLKRVKTTAPCDHRISSRFGIPPLPLPFVTAVICGAFAYGSMTYTMTAAPLAMIACGFSSADAALGIQWHIIGMFAPSFFTGRLIDRFGHQRVMLAGLVIVAVGALIALGGETLWHFRATLILLGVGWNFAYTGSTVMIARSAAGNVRLQGLADFLIFAFVAFASLFAGMLFYLTGWEVLNLTVLAGLLAVVWLSRRPAVAR